MSKRLTYVIIEDEENGVELIQHLMNNYFPHVQFSGCSGNVLEGIQLIDSIKPDILFLDIEIDLGTGFDILDAIAYKGMRLIFTTGYNEFAIKAIKYGAYDYLLKPLQIEEFKDSVNKAIDELTSNVNEPQTFYNPIKDGFKNLALRYNNQRMIVSPSTIKVVTSEGRYSHVNLQSGKQVVSSNNLGYFEEVLPSELFLRVHNTVLINRDFISNIDLSNYLLSIQGISESFPISKRKLKEVKEFFKLGE